MVLMYVDDDEEDRELFSEALAHINAGVKLIMAKDGIDALDVLARQTVLPDFIFIDINMPRMDGRQLLQELRKSQKYDPMSVIIYSTSLSPEDAMYFYDQGVFKAIQKPTDFGALCLSLLNLFKGPVRSELR